ncbi:DUF3108 domain-containing protein [Bacteroidales bacterium OttesenSCG-928-J19]|nr:DUF3108 domain-containing protein [Bacteroidales bacterium OttesenSCG-928-J19]
MNRKDKGNNQASARNTWRRENRKGLLSTFLSLLLFFVLNTQIASGNDLPFKTGESVKMEVKFKYGVVIKGGTFESRVDLTSYGETPAIKSTFLLNTNSFFDGIYKMRDTLISYADRQTIIPLHHWRSVNEGGKHFFEEMTVHAHKSDYSKVRVVRTEKKKVKVDKFLESNTPGFDLPNLFIYIRTLDYDSLSIGQTLHFSTFFGKRKTDIRCTYKGQQVVEKSKKLKYKTRKFSFDIMDEAFTESKNAIELWVSDDENRLPIKLKAKLKIGAAEGMITSYKGLKYPFTAEVKLR